MFARNYAEHYESLNQKKQYKKEIEFVYDWAHHPKRILDLGCGTAHYWQYYPEGVHVSGVERSSDMIALSAYKDRIAWHDVCIPGAFKKNGHKCDLVTALFDVMLYLPKHDWWKELPLSEGGYFIFDIWDKEKIERDGFKATYRAINGLARSITPFAHGPNSVKLRIELTDSRGLKETEVHQMFLYGIDDILEFAGKEFSIVDIKKTKEWRTWYKLKRK